MPFRSKKSKRKGWYGSKSRKYTKKEYQPDEQLKQADKNWITVNYNQFTKHTSGSMLNPVTIFTPEQYVHDNREIVQAISHCYVNCHPVFDQLDNLYEYLSRKNGRKLILDECFQDLSFIFQQHIWWFKKPEIQKNSGWHLNPEIQKISRRHLMYSGLEKSVDPKNLSGTIHFIYHHFNGIKVEEGGGDKTILLAFSGGKGGLATALFYKERGYDVRLFHICGINRAAGDEYEVAKALSERLELPLYVYNIRVNDGYYEDQYVEHPMRNIVIVNAMIHFALDHHIPPNIAFGTFGMDRLAYNCFDVCGGDCTEMWDAYAKIIQTVIPEFRVHIPIPHEGFLEDYWIKYPSLFAMATSCASSLQYRGKYRARVKKFFDLDLEEEYCGICWKCAKDYIFKCDHQLVEADYHYYIICITILKAQFDGERGYPCFDIYEIWNRFFYYNISKSVYHQELRQAKILKTGNISFPHHIVEDYYQFNAFKRVSSI